MGYKDKLNFEVEYELSKLIKMEIDRLKDLNIEKRLLKTRYDFSRFDAFKIIDVYKINSILREDLRNFLNRNNQYVTILDVENIMRRIDHD